MLFFCVSSFCQGQSDASLVVTDTSTVIVSDSLAKAKPKKKKLGKRIKSYFKDGYPSPRKAVVLTAIFPGLGQIYNRKYWYLKLPVVYGAFGGLIYSISFNRSEYLFLKEQHRFMVDGLPEPASIFEGRVSANVLKNRRDQHDKWLQMSYIGIGLAYILTAAEAFTTAHLLSFDVDDDLTMRLKPSFDFIPQHGAVMGFGIQLKLGSKKKRTPKRFTY
ncbi:MAG: DUF5683 domain-containing protein [Bacteroidota bacterium]